MRHGRGTQVVGVDRAAEVRVLGPVAVGMRQVALVVHRRGIEDVGREVAHLRSTEDAGELIGVIDSGADDGLGRTDVVAQRAAQVLAHRVAHGVRGRVADGIAVLVLLQAVVEDLFFVVTEHGVDAVMLDVGHPIGAGVGVGQVVLGVEVLSAREVRRVQVGQLMQVGVGRGRIATVLGLEIGARLRMDVRHLPVLLVVIRVVGPVVHQHVLGMLDVLVPVGVGTGGRADRDRTRVADVSVLGVIGEQVVRHPIPESARLLLVVVGAVVVADEVVDHVVVAETGPASLCSGDRIGGTTWRR